MTRKLFIALEGNIGIGKTTLGKKLAQDLDYDFYPEPLNGGIKRLREKFYENMEKYAGLFQFKIFIQRFYQHQESILRMTNRSAIHDRSIYGDKVFAYSLYESGKISSEELEVYEELWGVFRHLLVKPDIMLFLDASPEIQLNRILSRNRDGESNITIEHLIGINKKLITLENDRVADGVACYRIDWTDPNKNYDKVIEIIKYHENQPQSLWSKIIPCH